MFIKSRCQPGFRWLCAHEKTYISICWKERNFAMQNVLRILRGKVRKKFKSCLRSDLDIHLHRTRIQFDQLAETDFKVFHHRFGRARVEEEGSSFFNPNLLGIQFNLYFSDVVIDMGGYNIDEVLFDSVGVFLTRCKSAKALWSLNVVWGGSRIPSLFDRKITKRLEDHAQDSSAVKGTE